MSVHTLSLDEVWPLKFPRIPNADTPLETDTGLDQLLAATPAEYGMPVVDRDTVTEGDIEHGYALIYDELAAAELHDAAEARFYDESVTSFGVRGYYTHEEW